MGKFKRSYTQDNQNQMKHIINSKSPLVFLMVATIGTLFFLGNNHNGAIAQPISEINIGNTTSESSDTFFQLDDSIETIKVLINETQTAINNNNNTEAGNLLNQAYNELIQLSNNANNLIWDLSNQGN
jgi:Na+/H+ antiporter NhaC